MAPVPSIHKRDTRKGIALSSEGGALTWTDGPRNSVSSHNPYTAAITVLEPWAIGMLQVVITPMF